MPDLGCFGCWRTCCDAALDSTRGMNQQGEKGRSNEFEMNLVVIEEHQVSNLVFAQVDYLYIRLEATLAYVIVPIAKVLQTKYSSCQ